MDKVRVRFAPSPTGHLHIGNVRTALFNWLFARHNKGVFVLRIEDTDTERSSREAEKDIIEDLRWLGLTWDEGVDAGGCYGPYRQSERLNVYNEYVERLIQEGFAYRCYCTEEELDTRRAEQRALGQMPKYDGSCRDLAPDEAERLSATRRAAIRFKVPEGVSITFHDLIRGDITFESDTIGDFVIARSDGSPMYNFVVVVDDALMRISHVIRADEHLSNTAKQLLLYDALGFAVPKFAHVSMILGTDRSKLSKRHGATSLYQYRQEGFLPEAILNYLALLGWSDESGKEIMSLDDLVSSFTLERVAKSPAVFDSDKLGWMNSQYIRKEDPSRLVDMAVSHLVEKGYFSLPLGQDGSTWIGKLTSAVQDHLETMSQITDYVTTFFEDPDGPKDETASRYVSREEWPDVLNAALERFGAHDDYEPESIHQLLRTIPKDLGFGMKKTFMPIRVALTGSSTGIELHNLVSLLGKEATVKRLQHALQW
jgi:nondiscriminating glutamyl-tRNA synthetase